MAVGGTGSPEFQLHCRVFLGKFYTILFNTAFKFLHTPIRDLFKNRDVAESNQDR